MSRMMPGRVRQEGIDLYDAGLLKVTEIKNNCLFLKIDGESFSYALEDEKISCSCTQFQQVHYCPHLAAVEYFLKNDAQGKKYTEKLRKEEEEVVETERRSYFGSAFLNDIIARQDKLEVRYCLSAQGQLFPFDQQIDWTLKITRLPDQRAYIIRDIAAFLRVVKREGDYQIGKNYYEKLVYTAFDEASQELLDFLWKLVPEKSYLENQILVNFGRHLRLPLSVFEQGIAILQDLSSFEFSCDGESYHHLQILPFTAEEKLYCFTVEAHTKFLAFIITEKPVRSLFQGAYFLVGNQLYPVSPEQSHLIKAIAEISATDEEGRKLLQIDYQDKEKLALALEKFATIGQVKAPKQFQIRPFQPVFEIAMAENQELMLDVSLDFQDYRVNSQEQLDSLPFMANFFDVQKVFSTIESIGFRGRFQASRPALEGSPIYSFFVQDVPLLRSLGRVKMTTKVSDLFVQTPPQIQVEATGSLLDISFDFQGIGQDEVADALKALMAHQDYYTSQTGRVLVFDEETKRVSQTLAFLRAKYKGQGSLQVSKLASYQLAQAFTEEADVAFSQDFLQLVHHMRHPEEFPLPDIAVQAEIRDYQERGIRWLSMLDHYGFGGILADDMGLGKTLQTIAFLTGHLTKEARVLILAPSSLIYNWQDEFKKFAPQLDVAVIYGHKQERENQLAQDHQIVVTSYASFRQDIELYRANSYQYLILDEAQVMKNAQTKIAQQLRDFQVENCFALSGTPIENHLGEIWSIFQIVLPGLLPNKTAFAKLTAEEVAQMIRPFILRRRKEDVLKELPDLIEINVLNELSDDQKAIYLAQLHQMQETILASSEEQINRSKLEILSGITRLRQICDTPKLFMEEYRGQSGKMDSLKELLVQLKEGGHRVLIFSQFKTMLELIEPELEALGLTSYKLTGSTPSQLRQEMTTAFNNGSRDTFLISLKAGGVGLNLTGADTVILVDLWWNPAAEQQAISRAHRMGQTENVEFYRLITRGTIEEKIQELQESKKKLVTTVLDGNESRASLSVQEIREILGIS